MANNNSVTRADIKREKEKKIAQRILRNVKPNNPCFKKIKIKKENLILGYYNIKYKSYLFPLFEDEINKTGRILVVEVPPRPIGKVYKFEDVALMRVGEELVPMDDKSLLSILQEQEPDFSEQFCEGATFDDLDIDAIKVMKEKYAKKQLNPSFKSLDDRQALSDLHLINGNKN